jgi:hypothetical protein
MMIAGARRALAEPFDGWKIPPGPLAQRTAMVVIDPSHLGARPGEEVMAKGQMKGNKEAKKPKADKNQPKATASAYKLSHSKGGQPITPFTKKS